MDEISRTFTALILWAASAAGPITLLAQEPMLRLDLDEAVERATTRNENVLIARAERARAEGIVKETRAQSLPEITASFGYTRNIQTPVLFFNTPEGVQQINIGNDNDLTFNVNLRQPLLDFSLGPARTAARLAEDAGSASVESARTQAALAARLAYYQALLDRALLDVQEKALENAQARLRQVEEFYEAGTASEFDLLTAQVEVDNIRPRLIEARNRLELDRNELKRVIGVPLDREVQLTDSFSTPAASSDMEMAEALRQALQERADLRSQQLAVDLQQQSLTAERMDALPALSLNAGLSRRASSDDLIPPERDFSQTTSVGLSLEVPLFDGRSRAGRVQQAEAAVTRERFRLQQLREDVRLEVQQAVLALSAAREETEASRSNVRRAERALEIAQVRFRNGLSSQVEVNDAELAVTEARSNYANALYRYSTARARLTAATGAR